MWAQVGPPATLPSLADGGLFAFLWRLSPPTLAAFRPLPLSSRGPGVMPRWLVLRPLLGRRMRRLGLSLLALAERGRGRLRVVVANRLEGSDGFARPFGK